MFHSSVPVAGELFHNRRQELERLLALVRSLQTEAPSWLAILGQRKVGKTSLLMELARVANRPSVRFLLLDVLEAAPPSLEVFRVYALRALDRVLGKDLGVSLERLAHRPPDFRSALSRSSSFLSLPAAMRAEILEISERDMDSSALRFCLDLPEQLARALDLHMLVAIDEFQELASLSSGRRAPDLIPLIRSVWQKHNRVGYVISGSARSVITRLITDRHSPFFQHFALMELGPFSREDAISLLVERSPRGRKISAGLAATAADTLGGHPFYLQLLGEELVAQSPPMDRAALKGALQELLFSRNGRLALFFNNEFHRLVGRSTYLAATLSALAEGPKRLTDVATTIRASTGSTVRYLERLGDAVSHDDDGRYQLTDRVFALWLSWRRPGGSVVPMTLVGDEAERRVAQHLASLGFDLVYQSRASRGAFDLLALRAGHHLGVQVKRSSLPLRFSKAEWNRMHADARRFGWDWIVAAVAEADEVTLLDPAGARKAREVRLGAKASIENLLTWLDD